MYPDVLGDARTMAFHNYLRPSWARNVVIALLAACLFSQGAGVSQAVGEAAFTVYLPTILNPVGSPPPAATIPIVFVSRQIPNNGSIYWNVPKDQPGVGPHSRFRVAAPGQLLVREPDGQIRILVDGSQPNAASLNLIDVNAPDVSYDGTKIIFAGLPSGSYGTGPNNNPGAWRLYSINVAGSGLQQITQSDTNVSLSQFGAAAGGLFGYDDTDPAWLPNGQIVFSSTRWPSYGHYSGVRVTNLYVINPNGTGLRRITSERNGADRPMVDPVTGKIVYARWWRNHRFALNSLSTVTNPSGGYSQKDGLSADRNNEIDGSSAYNDLLWRNAWQAATINPDGMGLALWAGSFRDEAGNHVYGGAFTPAGDLVANFFPMYNMTEAAGFGGLRRYQRGAGSYTALLGQTTLSINYAHPSNPTSFGIYTGAYATEPEVLPDGSLVLSWVDDVYQDYGLYRAQADGSGLTLMYDRPGTTELRARAIYARPLPPVLPGPSGPVPSLLPPAPGSTNYTQDGTFVFSALNVYFNAPVDWDIVNAPSVGSAATIRFFLDHQRTSQGSFPSLDWPILLGEESISAAGFVSETAPAWLPLFEQLRSASGTVPLTRSPTKIDGAAHVAGMNFAPANAVARCVGCHAGHTLIPVPATDAEAQWTNLATGAQVFVSSTRDANSNRGVIDRRVLKGEIWRYWTSNNNPSQDGQWVRLEFPVPISVRTVRLYNPRFGDEANSTLQVQSALVQLCADTGCSSVLAQQTVGALAVSGTSLSFADVTGVRAVRVTLTDVAGVYYGMDVGSVAEIEVIARGE